MSEIKTVRNNIGHSPIHVPQMAVPTSEPTLHDLQTMGGSEDPMRAGSVGNQSPPPTVECQSYYRRSTTAPTHRNLDSRSVPEWLMERPASRLTAPDSFIAAQKEPLPQSGGSGGVTSGWLQEVSPLPREPRARKDTPIARGFFDYFPDAIVAVAQLSHIGNKQHNPGAPLFWDRSKSTDEADALMRHFLERGTVDVDGVRHSTKVAWRALALLQKEIEKERINVAGLQNL
jgi:hypothetical protein